MFKLHKIKNLLKYLICLLFICISINDAHATCGSPGAKCPYKFNNYQAKNKAQAPGAPQEVTQAYAQMQELQSKIEALCDKGAEKKDAWYKPCLTSETIAEGMEELNIYKQYAALVKQHEQLTTSIIDHPIDDANACGPNFPWGCPSGQFCIVQKSESGHVSGGGMNAIYTGTAGGKSDLYYTCAAEVPENSSSIFVKSTYEKATPGAANTTNETHTTSGGLIDVDGSTTANGETNIKVSVAGSQLYEVGDDTEGDAYTTRTNDECNIPGLKDAYLSTCYSCRIVGQMLEVFLTAANQAFGVTSEAGIKLLTIGMFIWIAIYILKQISKFVQPEPMVMLQELFNFFFKCVVAYIAITSGLRIFTDLIISPILKTGADFGIAMIESVMPDLLKTDDDTPLAQDEPYSVEPIQNQQQASQVAQQNDVTIRGQVKLSQLRPENMSQLNESGMNYCQIGGDHDHAFGAHQLDYRYAAADFAKTCANPQFNKAYTASGYDACAKNAYANRNNKSRYYTMMEECGKKLRSQIKPIVEQLCKKPPQPQGQNQMKQLQQTYYEKNIYQKAFDAANKQFNLNPKLTIQNYTDPQYFTLSAALISAQVAGEGHRNRFLNNVGSCAQPCDFNKLGAKIYGQLDSWGKSNGLGNRFSNELDWCNKKLAYLGMGGVNDFDNVSTPTNNYYVAKTKDNSTVLIAIPKAADGRELIDDTVMSRLMYLSKKVDNAVSINFVIGNAVTCHSTHAGAIQFAQKVTDLIGIKFYFPNVWLWICGIIIWVFAFMLVIGVNFYLLDIGFKIGLVLLLMPVALGLWPFASPFNKVFSALMKQIIHAAGIFAFLGVSTAMSISIISAAMGNTDTLLQAIQNNDTEYVSETFGLWSGSFILIIFAYLYSHKLISETVDKLTNKFFDGDMTGNSIHTMTVQAMDWCKSKVTAVAGLVAGAVTGGASSAAQIAGKAAVKTAASTARGVGRGVGAVARKFKRGNNNN